VDEYGFVWHGHYLAWFEAARIEMLREVNLTPGRLLDLGYLVPVVDVRLTCKRPVGRDAEVTVFCSVEPTEKALITFRCRIVDAASGELCASARSSHVLMNRRGTFLYRIPDEIAGPLRELIERYPAEEGGEE